MEYSLSAPGELVVADDSGLEVDALNGSPGVHSARYAADQPHLADENTDDEANNSRVLRELRKVPPEKRTGRFVCVLAVARDGNSLASFRGAAEGINLTARKDLTVSGTIRCFIFRKFRRPSRNYRPKRKPATAIGVRRFANFSVGTRSNFWKITSKLLL